jgi:hypothetical protein
LDKAGILPHQKASKSENLLFAGLYSKKGQAELALFW